LFVGTEEGQLPVVCGQHPPKFSVGE
jgi:hypothetical protein